VKILYNNSTAVSTLNHIFRYYPYVRLDKFTGSPMYIRFCPSFMFVLEVLTKCLMLSVIGVVSINDYGTQYGHDFSSVLRLWSDSEFLLAVLFFSVLFYKISELWSLDGASNDICLILGMFLTVLSLCWK
jgi:hypothetical protein